MNCCQELAKDLFYRRKRLVLDEGKLSPKRALSSSKISCLKNEGKGKTFLLKMSFIYMIIKNSFSYQWLRT